MLINDDCLKALKNIDSNSVDCVITDPPYLYLNHKLDKSFNELELFTELYRVLKKDSYLCFFGRGVALQRWACICDSLGFKFKEELVWDKGKNSNPLHPLGRKHELIYVFAKGNPTLNRVYIDKIEYDKLSNEFQKIENDSKKLISKIKSIKTYEDFTEWIKGDYVSQHNGKHSITINQDFNKKNKCIGFTTYEAHTRGALLSTLLRVNTEHYNFKHPTQKPIKLMELLIQLLSKENDLILDPFMGSGSTCVAGINTNRNYIGIELDKEYFEIANDRVKEAINLNRNLFNCIV